MKKKLTRIFQLKIEHLHFILYNNGLCRVDNNENFTTIHYTGKDRLKWWGFFKKVAEATKVPQLIIDQAFIAFTGI